MRRRFNGAGSIVYLKDGNRTRRFLVRLPGIEWVVSKNGKPYKKVRTLGAYATYDEAEAALSQWKMREGEEVPKDVTVADVWELFKDAVLSTRSDSNVQAYTAAYGNIKPLYKTRIDKLPFAKMQKLIRELPTRGAQSTTRALLCALEEYSKVLGIAPIGCTTMLDVDKEAAKVAKRVFTSEEIQQLWNKRPLTNIPLILLYTGMRISELCELKSDNVYWDERYCIAGVKTEAGKNRVIPLRKEIIPVMQEQLYKYKAFVNYKNAKTTTSRINDVLHEIGLPHSSHECRHTFTTCAVLSGVPVHVVDKITGHVSNNTSIDVYTHYPVEKLVEAVDTIVFV